MLFYRNQPRLWPWTLVEHYLAEFASRWVKNSRKVHSSINFVHGNGHSDGFLQSESDHSMWTERVSVKLFPRRKGIELYLLPIVQSKIKVHKLLSQTRDIWEPVFCFVVILSLSVRTQIMATTQTRFLIHSSKERVERYISCPSWNYTGFSKTVGCKLLGKIRKTVKCTGQNSPKTAIIVDENRKPEAKLEKTSKPCKTPKIGQIRKTENPKTPSWTTLRNLIPKLQPFTSQFIEKQSCDTNVFFRHELNTALIT